MVSDPVARKMLKDERLKMEKFFRETDKEIKRLQKHQKLIEQKYGRKK
jgi:hypothetical protein